MGTSSVVQSLLIALWVAVVTSRWLGGGTTLILRLSPLVTGLVVGLIMGEVAQTMIVIATLQMIYMGVFSPGGSMPAEPSIAAAIAVPVVLLGDLSPEVAIAVAVSVGLLGGCLYQFRFSINTFLGKYIDKVVKDLNTKAMAQSIILCPMVALFLLFVPLVFIALYLGVPLIANVIKALEGTVVIHILEIVGGGLAAAGIMTTVYVIGRKDCLVFFFLAYFMSVALKSLDTTMITYVIFGIIIALIFVQSQKGKQVQSATSNNNSASSDDEDDRDDGS